MALYVSGHPFYKGTIWVHGPVAATHASDFMKYEPNVNFQFM